jgi:hypothetical protein
VWRNVFPFLVVFGTLERATVLRWGMMRAAKG